MNRPLHIMFAGGGTGGHLFPGLAVAAELCRPAPGTRITFCGTGKDWERQQVAKASHEYVHLRAAPVVASLTGVMRAIWSNSVGFRAGCRMLALEPPDAVVGLGGYGSVPLGLAAARRSVPLVLLEPNAVPGRATRLLARWAASICISFRATADSFAAQARLVLTGNPVRAAIVDQSPRVNCAAEPAGPPTLLVLGGSQGAHGVNRAVVESLPATAAWLAGWRVIHQAGSRDADWVADAYRRAGLKAAVEPFIEDMAAAYARAELAICRAGATTLAELATVGVPAVLLPYPAAAANHQWHNARCFEQAGAAVIVPDEADSAARLIDVLPPLLESPDRRVALREAMHRLARPHAAADVAGEIIAVARSRRANRRCA